jgi:PPOX class probable F420-dependent enzyme
LIACDDPTTDHIPAFFQVYNHKNYNTGQFAEIFPGESIAMIDLNTVLGTQVDQRLRDEEVIWLTTVSPDGVPHPNPVWFFWDGQEIILYSQPKAYRIRNLRLNPKVALNLQGAGPLGEAVVVIYGEARLDPHYRQPHPGYAKKYQKFLSEMNMTLEQLIVSYSVEIRIRPTRLRGM